MRDGGGQQFLKLARGAGLFGHISRHRSSEHPPLHESDLAHGVIRVGGAPLGELVLSSVTPRLTTGRG